MGKYTWLLHAKQGPGLPSKIYIKSKLDNKYVLT